MWNCLQAKMANQFPQLRCGWFGDYYPPSDQFGDVGELSVVFHPESVYAPSIGVEA